MTTNPEIARRATRRWPVISAGTALIVSIGIGLLLLQRENSPFGFDVAWLATMVDVRTEWLTGVALVFDFLGGHAFGIYVVPIGLTLALVIARKPFSALFFFVSSVISAVVVQALKVIFGRARPEELLLAIDSGSFPSGHVANAATISVVLAIILGRTWVWIAGVVYTVLMALSRTYLGVHWLSDTIGGALLGAGVVVLVWAPLASRVQKEWSGARRADSVAP